jgi:hypothetical protein
MRNNITAMMHPSFRARFSSAYSAARLEACRNPYTWQRAYVANRKGNNIMRIDLCFEDGRRIGFRVWGDCSRDITKMVEDAWDRYAHTFHE